MNGVYAAWVAVGSGRGPVVAGADGLALGNVPVGARGIEALGNVPVGARGNGAAVVGAAGTRMTVSSAHMGCTWVGSGSDHAGS